MNDSFTRFVGFLAVWIIALLPLLLFDREVSRLAASLVAAHGAMDVARP